MRNIIYFYENVADAAFFLVLKAFLSIYGSMYAYIYISIHSVAFIYLYRISSDHFLLI